MKKTFVEFGYLGPEHEIVEVADTDIGKLTIPPLAVQFQFVACPQGAPPVPLSKLYFIGTETGTAEEMKTRYPRAKRNINMFVKECGPVSFARVDFPKDAQGYGGDFMLVPLIEEFALISRDKKIIWPKPAP